MRSIQTIFSILSVIIALLLHSNAALASTTKSGSIEFMCKAKAKEIAVETYSGCINDNKQAELERIRKEYQDELSKVKAKYNSELQGLTGGKKSKATPSGVSRSMRGDMPAKKMKTSRVKTEKIDFSSDKSEETQPEAPQNDLGDHSSEGAQTISSTEIVELPMQEE